MSPIERRAEEIRQRYPDALEPRPTLFQLRVSMAVAIILLSIGAIQTAGPDTLGIPPLVFRWLGVLSIIFTGIQAFLPPVKRWIQGGK